MKRVLRRAAPCLAAATLALPVASAAAAPSVHLSVSSPWALAGFPLTATVTSSEAGTISLMQLRKSRVIGPGWCVSNTVPFEHPLPATTRPIAAGQTVTVKLDASRLAFAGGTPFVRPNFDTCADPQTSFAKLVATFITADNTSQYTSPARRLQRVW